MIIESRVKNYSVDILKEVLSKKQGVLKDIHYRKLYFFIDENVFNIYKDKIKFFIQDADFLVIPANEYNKDYTKLVDYYKWLVEKGFMRSDLLITIGGGILQDISGFIASTLYRGIKWVFLPTTLLSQADSCIGSKTSINFLNNKNLIGSFYPPDRIFIAPSFCNTLTDEYFNSGIGEIIKFHLLSDSKGYERLRKYLAAKDLKDKDQLSEIIMSTLKIKKSYFSEDEFDTGRRNLLNYGHCFGHALEAASNFAVCHGEAVIVGMSFANLLSLKRGLMTENKYLEFENIFKEHYPDFDISKISIDNLLYHLKRDKKRVGKDLTMILCQDVGKHYKVDDIREEEVRDIYKKFISKYMQGVS